MGEARDSVEGDDGAERREVRWEEGGKELGEEAT